MGSLVEIITIRRFRFAVFDPTRLRLGVVPVSDRESPRSAKPLAYKDLITAFPAACAALNGPWAGWGVRGAPPKDDYKHPNNTSMYLESAYRDIWALAGLGLDVPPCTRPRGKMLTPLGASRGMTLGCDHTGKPFVRPGWSRPDDAPVAVQLPMPLVLDGAVAAPRADKTDPWRAPTHHLGGILQGNWVDRTERAGLGVLRTGQMLMGGGLGSTEDFARAMIECGCAWAGYTDGGGSYHLVYRDPADPEGRTTMHACRRPERPTPSWLLVAADDVTNAWRDQWT
jgi:hypothetical protein